MSPSIYTVAAALAVATPPPADFAAYEPVAQRIAAAAQNESRAYERLEELCDDIGPRLSGSRGLERAIEWAVATFRADEQESIRREQVMVPRWVRGQESAKMVAPYERALPMLGLGGSVGTSVGGLTAEVCVVSDEEELEEKADELWGQIVLFDNPMPDYDPEKGAQYGRTVRFRANGARLAAEHGAVGCLVRSVTARSLHTPHTGGMNYGDASVKIPAAAITAEDAALIHRLTDRGKRVRVELKMDARDEGEVPSANVVAELRGTTAAQEVVVIGAHLDSWDVGQGAHDDGSGCATVIEALATLRRLGLRPRRTIRAVLFTNEENGLAGARAYAENQGEALSRHAAAIECDSGGFRPRTLSVKLKDEGKEARAASQLEALLPLVSSVGVERVTTGGSGADVSQMVPAGVPTLGLRTEGSRYFDYHHTHADTFDKVDKADLDRNVAALAIAAYVLADMPGRLGD